MFGVDVKDRYSGFIQRDTYTCTLFFYPFFIPMLLLFPPILL